MAILIVLHNAELAAGLASHLRRSGRNAKAVHSVTGSQFLKEFPQSELLVTDLAPPVLGFLNVAGQNLLHGTKPLIVLASPGHCASFSSMLPPDRARCIAVENDLQLFERIRLVAQGLLEPAVAQPRVQVAKMGCMAAKRIAADPGHPPRSNRFARKALDRQVQFVSDIAHDLRTPLTAIYEFAHLMRSGISGEINDQQRRYVNIIERRCDEASRMLYDLLDGARLQSGRIHTHRQSIELRDVFADVEECLEPALRHSGIKLSVEVPEGLPRVFADRDMLARIVANLVSNAIKFSSPQSSVVTRAERHSVPLARVSVIDSGSGISPEDLRRIFHRFEQGANRAVHGVGLGLAIVRELVKLHDGRITVQSSVGKGSQFDFTIPFFLPTAIVRRYFAQLVKTQEAASIWGFTCADLAKYDAIHRLITSSVRARDLVLPADDQRRILLVTHSRNAERLLERLRHQIASYGAMVPTVCRLTQDDLKDWLGSPQIQHRPFGPPSSPTQLAG